LAEFFFIVADSAGRLLSNRLQASKPTRMLAAVQTRIYPLLHTIEIAGPQVVCVGPLFFAILVYCVYVGAKMCAYWNRLANPNLVA
jgi:hypothetical protein